MTERRRTGPADPGLPRSEADPSLLRSGADPGLPRSAGGPACSARSRLRAEDLTATASPGARWLLVEVAGAWGWNVWTQSPVLDPVVGAALARRAQGAGMRILAVRRPGRSRGSHRWRWAIVDADRATLCWGEVASAEDLLTLPLDGSTGIHSDQPLFAVCAHGRHDECCAVRGRSVAERLSEAYPDETWECSHLGGDRFAATMMLFPHGLSHGRVDELDPLTIADEYLQGRVAPDGFRGRSTQSHAEQAAVAAAVERSGDTRIEAFRVVRTEENALGWSVDLASATGTVRVRLEQVRSEPTFTTCRATLEVAVPRFVVRDVRDDVSAVA